MTTFSLSPDQIRDLLPFHANGTLTGGERAAVEAALRTDDVLRTEADRLSGLRQALRDLPLPPSPGEFGLARLRRDIDRETIGSREKNAPSRVGLRPRVAAAAAIAAALVLAVGIGLSGRGTVPGYQQASGSAGAGDMSVAFVQGISVEAMTDLLHRNGLSLVDGPSAIGLYRVAVAPGADPAAVAAKLRAEAGLIENVSLTE